MVLLKNNIQNVYFFDKIKKYIMIKLKNIRLKMGLKQWEVAEKLGIKTQTYENYELGRREPNLDTLLQLADFFHVSLDELFGRENCDILNLNMLEKEEQSIIKTIRRLNKINLVKVETYALAKLEEQDSQK